MKRWIAALGLAAAGSAFSGSGTASEWGCEVLLCASSSNPSWRGVPACHLPMYRLISAMKRPGFSWPTCPEGGAESLAMNDTPTTPQAGLQRPTRTAIDAAIATRIARGQ